ncbi:MAG TPA: homoserine dehydrogenase [Candidatus Sulfomarinibacteraceae bacterium]|nr:homoserine dehydrogenase [Candidatus Sulfomarinibacteraceae bacterium]
MTATLRVAVLGAGTVGREVIRAFLDRPETLRAADGAELRLAGVAVRDIARAIAGGIPESLLTDAPAHLVAAPETDVVVELMGGDEPARTLLAAALSAGRPVVTANKHVLAHHGPALEAIARRTGAAFRFEAAVGGGIPVLGPLALDLAANRIEAVRGIVNGTTNFILSAMASDGRAYADVLADAQRAGYAEADPRGDVEGDDAANKLAVLARQAFGRWLDVGSIGRAPALVGGGLGLPGITGVTVEDIAAAAARGFAIKLVAAASRTGSGDGIEASVRPSAVPLEAPLGRTNGVLNRIEVDGAPIGRVAFDGPGAGGSATSSAVLGDLVAIARGAGSTWAGLAAAAGTILAGRPADGETFDAPSGARYPVIR